MLTARTVLSSRPHLGLQPPARTARSANHLGNTSNDFSAQPRQTCRRPAICQASLVLQPQLVFNAITFCVMPLYALMTVFPSRKLTKNVMSSPLLYTAAALLYGGALMAWGREGILQLMWDAIKQYIHTWQVEKFAILFLDPMITSLTWLHLLVLDLFVARHVYLDGLQRQVVTAHSVILCFMFGPTGLLSHMLTKSIAQKQGRQTPQVQ